MHRTHYLIWRRGFAPVLFILAIALIFVAVGSGVYFATREGDSTDIIAQPESQPIEIATTSTSVTASTSIAEEVVEKVVNKTAVHYDCGSSDKALACLNQRLQSCTPAKGVVTDPTSKMKVERIIDGYNNDSCFYRSKIIFATGIYSIIDGMNFDCAIPKAILATTIPAEGSISNKDMLTYCTGTFVDLLRQQPEATQ